MVIEASPQSIGVTPRTDRVRDAVDLRRGAERREEKDFRNSVEDRVSLGEENQEAGEVTYDRQIEEARRLGSKFLMLRELVAKTFKEQGIATTIDIGDGKTMKIEEMTPEEAQKLVADDGYWGVEQTSDRIVELVTSLAGDDVSLLEKIKEGVTKGFEMAKKDFGMQLPEISRKTFDAVMTKLDEWSKGTGSGDEPENAAAKAV